MDTRVKGAHGHTIRTTPSRYHTAALIGAVVAWNSVFVTLALRQHAAFQTGFDLAVFTQLLWSTSNGRPFWTSLIGESTFFLGYHFSPLLVALVPLYVLWPDARTLLVAQATVLSGTSLLLYAFARRRVGGTGGLMWALAFLLYPPLHYLALNEFHAISLAVPLLMAAACSLVNFRYRAAAFNVALALLVKEEVAFIAVAFGVAVLAVQHKWRLGWWWTGAAFTWTIVLFGILMPSFSTTGTAFAFMDRYSALGRTPTEAMRTVLTSPETVVRLLGDRDKVAFLWQMSAPLVGLPLLSGTTLLLMAPTLGYLLLSNYRFHYMIQYHYTAPLIPLLFVGGVVGAQRLARVFGHRPQVSRVLHMVLLGGALVAAWWWSPLPGARLYVPQRFQPRPEHRVWDEALHSLPRQAAVVADWEVLPHVANRRLVDVRHRPPFLLTAPGRVPDYVIARQLPSGSAVAPLYPWLLSAPEGEPIRVPRFKPVAELPGGLMIWKDRGRTADIVLEPHNVPFEAGLLLAGSRVMWTQSGTLDVWLAWRTWAPVEERITFTVHVVNSAGKHVAQVDKEVGNGQFPTTLWRTWVTDPLVVGRFSLELPNRFPPGTYRLLVGAYVADPFRVVLRQNGDMWYPLQTITLEPR
ncbi:MAG: DUF2079 domain-containing protein [Ardenticatenia bacterium]|nr:DUF2079 domain-containing protein [Ardenticatenia bacterium]